MHKEEFKTLPLSVIEFLNYMSIIKNKSELTVLEYASDLRLFFKFLLMYRKKVDSTTEFEKIDISKIDLDLISTVSIQDAYAFLSYCKTERKNDAASRARKASALRAYFKYMAVNTKQIEDACTRITPYEGAIIEEALKQGYLHYDENEPKRILGAFLEL